MTKEEKQEEIKKKILAAGGKMVHVTGNEAEVDMIASKGQLFDGETSIVEGGPAMLCHDNSLKFYLANKGMRLCTGYAATVTGDDYMWVKHSWCIDKDGIIHECTPEKRDKYYGAIMDEREAERFRRENDFAYDAECRRKEEMGEKNVSGPENKGIKGWMKRTFGSKQEEPSVPATKMTLREYAEHKGIDGPLGDVYTRFKLLKMAREDGIDLTVQIYTKMPAIQNVTLGKRIEEGIDAGNTEFNSLDESLDFDKLARQMTGKEDMTWDEHMAQLEKEDREKKAKVEAESAARAETNKEELATVIGELKQYSYEEPLAEYADPEKANGLTITMLKDALAVIRACESGESPRKAMDRLNIEKPTIIMTLISEISKKGPEMYKTYVSECGLSIEDLGEETQKRIEGIEERNARYDVEIEREQGFGETLGKVTDDVEFAEFVENEGPSIKGQDEPDLSDPGDGEIV